MELKIEIKNRFTGKVLFELSTKNNSVKETLEAAVKENADLRGAVLTGAVLTGADLRGAVLMGAVLTDYKIKVAAVFTGLYTYIVIPYITEENQHRVKMGCHDRSVTDWDSDFWNNDKEFPNDNSVRSNLRLMAYNTAKEWLKIQSDDTTSNPSAEEA